MHGDQRFLHKVLDNIVAPGKATTKKSAQGHKQRAQQRCMRSAVAGQACKHQSPQAIIIMPHAHSPLRIRGTHGFGYRTVRQTSAKIMRQRKSCIAAAARASASRTGIAAAIAAV
jgi:hypothetical protein